jgi:hypothetical protein
VKTAIAECGTIANPLGEDKSSLGQRLGYINRIPALGAEAADIARVIPASHFVDARSVLRGLGAPCSSLISNWRDTRETAVPQAFLTFSAACSLLFSKITLILAK